MAYGIQALRNTGNRSRMESQPVRELSRAGRGGDTTIGHLTEGEVVIPEAYQTPGVMALLAKEMRRQGTNPAEFEVGNRFAKRNPQTGAQEFQADPDHEVRDTIPASATRFGAGRSPDPAILGDVKEALRKYVETQFSWDTENVAPETRDQQQRMADLELSSVLRGSGGFTGKDVETAQLMHWGGPQSFDQTWDKYYGQTVADLIKGRGSPLGDSAVVGGIGPGTGSQQEANFDAIFGGTPGTPGDPSAPGPANEQDIETFDIMRAFGVPHQIGTFPDYSDLLDYGEGPERRMARFAVPATTVLTDAEIDRRGGVDALRNEAVSAPNFPFYNLLSMIGQ